MSDAARLDVLTLGEAMVLFAAAEPGPLPDVSRFTRHLAGAESNVATGLARLGHRVRWLSRVGCDAFGDYVLRTLAAEGVDVSRVARDPERPTGFMLKARAQAGQDPQVQYHRRGSAASALSPADWQPGDDRAARHLHVTGITPALSAGAAALVALAMRTVRAAGGTVSFDPNLRPSLWPDLARMREAINTLTAEADWVLPGLGEGRLLCGCEQPADIAAFYLARGARTVVVKLGADGASCHQAEGMVQVPAVAVDRVVDTVGAGDGFAAGLISARLDGLPWPAALARANWVGAQAIQVVGDMEGLPTRAQLPPGL